MFELKVERTFWATHALRMYDGEMEEMHGHEWKVVTVIAADGLDEIDVVMDFHELESIIESSVRPFVDKCLNEVPELATVNPSAERVAEYIGKQIHGRIPDHVQLLRVTVTEAPGCDASWLP